VVVVVVKIVSSKKKVGRPVPRTNVRDGFRRPSRQFCQHVRFSIGVFNPPIQMRALASSIVLPLLSHVARQSFACADDDELASTTFLVFYACALLIHSEWVDDCNDVRWFRIVVFAAGFTFVLSAVVFHTSGLDTTFVICWAVHAAPAVTHTALGEEVGNTKVTEPACALPGACGPHSGNSAESCNPCTRGAGR
jgi:hypothetical protein